jgi:transitional endoplasmic reticulum ATPase
MERVLQESSLRPNAIDIIDEVESQWRDVYRQIFRVCVGRVSATDHLSNLAITIVDSDELLRVVNQISGVRRRFQVDANTWDQIEAVAHDVRSDPNVPNVTFLRETLSYFARANHLLGSFIVGRVYEMCPCKPTHYPRIVRSIARLYSLEQSEIDILITLYAITTRDSLIKIFNEMPPLYTTAILAEMASLEQNVLMETIAPGRRLERLGLIIYAGNRPDVLDIQLTRPLQFTLRSNSIDDLWAGLFSPTPEPVYKVSDFSVSEVDIRSCISALRGGRSVLISGAPGLGKSEFARSLVMQMNQRIYTLAINIRHVSFSKISEQADPVSTRVSAIRLAANLLDRTRDVLVVDEADTILQSATGIGGSFGFGSYDKANLNNLLDTLPVPAIWIVNEHGVTPTSAMRRFGHAIQFPRPTIEMRTRMLNEKLPEVIDQPLWKRDLATNYDMSPAAIDRMGQIIGTETETGVTTHGDVPTRVGEYLRRSTGSAVAMDIRKLRTVDCHFDPRFCNTSTQLDRIERLALHRSGNNLPLRILFSGPPGSGKTQYALWLAKRILRDAILKHPSDFLSKYVGDTEKRIAVAFREAADSGSVLIIDEADALLYDRSIAVRSWEHSQIAEFLQQIPEYEGILVACTNRIELVDPALRRRFHKHVFFGTIDPDVLPAALHHIFPDITFSDVDIDALHRGPAIVMSDLTNARDMVFVDAELGVSLEMDQEASCGSTSEPIPKSPAKTMMRASEAIAEILSNAQSRDNTRKAGF